MNEQDIIETALRNLREHTGIKGKYRAAKTRHEDGEAEFAFANELVNIPVEIKREVKPYQVPDIVKRAGKDKPFMVVATKLFREVKAELRRKKINYLDTAGNVYLAHGPVLLQVDGYKNEEDAKPATNRAFTKTGLRVVFHFLLNEHALNQPYRETAMMTGVALGNIKYIVDGLKEAGYIVQMTDRKCLLKNKKGLLERWIAGYRETLKPNLHIGNFKLPLETTTVTLQERIGLDPTTVLGGEPAAEILTQQLRPEIYTIYTDLGKNDLVKAARVIPDPNGNLRAYKRFWRENYPVTMDANVTHPLLIYADLVITDDPRCIETAEIIYNLYLKHEFEQR